MFLRVPALLTICLLIFVNAFCQPPIGNWREHLPYHQAMQVEQGDGVIICATPYSLFTVDPLDNTINRLSKINGLSETGISAIRFDQDTKKMVVAYANSNIDILSSTDIVNIDDLKNKNTAADKSVNDIYCYKAKAYLSTGLGVVVLDEDKYEVNDTYVIGDTGNFIKVNGFCSDGAFFYAATDEGLKKAPSNGVNLADYRNWTLLNGIAAPCSQVMNISDKVIAQRGDSMFVLDGNAWKLLYTSNWNIVSSAASASKLVLAQKRVGGESRVLVLNADGSTDRILQQPGLVVDPRAAVLVNNTLWVADSSSGLLQSSGSSLQQVQPNSPLSIATGQMFFYQNALWVAAGSVTEAWSNTFSKNGIYRFLGNEWTNYNSMVVPLLDSVYDIVSIAADSRDNSVWAGSFGSGLLQIKPDNTINVFKHNSVVEPALDNPQQYRVAGLAFDKDHNLWVANYGAARDLGVIKADGTSRKFSIPFFHTGNAVSQLLVDDNNQVWIISPGGNGLFCFNYGSSIDNTADDQWKYYQAGHGNGNLPGNNVLSIAKDKNGFIWVGTDRGIGIIQCPPQVFRPEGCEAILPIVQQDNFAGYLFSNEQVQCIAVDGADRKWIGTKNGAWLVGADAAQTIYRFREGDSPLLSNDVKNIAIDPVSGEVFFATSKGICSFRGTATEAGTVNENVLVFPNPVPPQYKGTIGIRGLVNNAIVKITEPDGRLVYETRANGGQATWNGLNYKGKRVSTGVYLVIVSDESRREKLVSKIVFIQ